jgi:DNA-binding HxlR family transcriptional regulator
MIRTNPPSELVSAERIAQVIELLQGKWTVHILCVLCKGSVRLGELRRALPTASKKSLTASLRSLGKRVVWAVLMKGVRVMYPHSAMWVHN